MTSVLLFNACKKTIVVLMYLAKNVKDKACEEMKIKEFNVVNDCLQIKHNKVFGVVLQRRFRKFHGLILILFLFLFSGMEAKAQVNYRYFLNLGQQEISRRNFVEAIKVLNIAIASERKGFEAFYLRGIAKYNLGDYKGAENDFSSTLSFHPLYVRAYYFRGICRDQLFNYTRAIEDFNKALETDPFNPDVYLARGDTKMHLKNYKSAVSDYSESIKLKDNISAAWLSRGVARYFLKENDLALSDLNRAIELDYFNPDCWLKRGMVKYELDSLEGALSDFNRAIGINAELPYVYFQRGLTHLKLHDTISALRDYDTVLMKDPGNALTYYNIALIKSNQKKYSEAIDAYNETIKINPNNVYAHYNRAIVYYQMADYQSALADFTKAIEIFPDFTGAIINRSYCYQKMGKEKEAAIDKMRAEKIIAYMNGESKDNSVIYKRFADSTYFNRIMEFEADFVSGNMKKGRVQYSRVYVEPKPNIFLMYDFDLPDSPPLEKPKFEYLDDGIAAFNAQNKLGARLYYSSVFKKIDDALIYDELNKLDTSMALAVDTAAKLFLKGLISTTNQEFATAYNDFEECLKKDKNIPFAWFNLGAVRYEIEELIFEQKEKEGSPKISLNDPEPVKIKSTPNHNKSLDDFTQAIKHRGALPFAYYNLANIKVSQKKFQRAIDDFSMALKLEPELAEAWFNRALVLLYLEEYKLACNDLSRAGELGISESYNLIKRYCNK